ncbi:MAG: MauE/DoxX family redox-associated membrane protein [Bacillota bacterium]
MFRTFISSGRLQQGLLIAVRLALGITLLVSALPKILRPYDFLGNIYEYQLVGPTGGMIVAMILPWLELLLGVCLIGGLFLGGSLFTAAALMIVFTAVQSSALHRSLPISCGCFGTTGAISYGTLLRTALLLLAAATGCLCLITLRPPPAPIKPPTA